MSINLINPTRPYEINSKIVEWDIKRAGLNLIKENHLLSDSVISELEKMQKQDADIIIGKMQIKDKDFSKNLESAFTDIMEKFLSENNIDKDIDVTSIKKDACFVINKDIKVSEFGNYIKFIPKNEYHAYIYIKPLEIYFKRNGDIDIKGLVGDKKLRKQIISIHENGIINFLKYVVELTEETNMNKKRINKFLHEFVDMYKKKELEFDYYREFNIESRFRYQFMNAEIMTDNIDESMLEKVNIEYNYTHIILPLINLLC